MTCWDTSYVIRLKVTTVDFYHMMHVCEDTCGFPGYRRAHSSDTIILSLRFCYLVDSYSLMAVEFVLHNDHSNGSDLINDQIIFEGGISGVVCFFVCILILIVELTCLYRRKTKFVLRYFIYLTVACTLYTGTRSLYLIHSFIDNDSFDDSFCKALGFLNCYVKLLMLCCMTVLVVLILFNVFGCRQRPDSVLCLYVRKYYLCTEFVFILCIFVSPLFFSWIPFLSNHFGKDGSYCWIQTAFSNGSQFQEIGVLEEMLLWLVPLYTAATAACVSVLLIAVRLCYLLLCMKKLMSDKRVIVAKESCLLLALFMISVCVVLSEVVMQDRIHNVAIKQTLDLVLSPIVGAILSLISCSYISLTICIHQRRVGYHPIPRLYGTIDGETAPLSSRISPLSWTSQRTPFQLSPSDA